MQLLVVESHSEWTGLPFELRVLASQSPEGQRAVLNRMAWQLPDLQEPLQRTSVGKSADESADEICRAISNFCLQPRELIEPRLIILGSLLYAKNVRTEIRKETVKNWKSCLSDEGYHLIVKGHPQVFAADFDRLRQQSGMPAPGDLLKLERGVARNLLQRVGMVLIEVCLELNPSVSSLFNAKRLSTRLLSIMPPADLATLSGNLATPSGNLALALKTGDEFQPHFPEMVKILQIWQSMEILK
jgi:hypothetical protein